MAVVNAIDSCTIHVGTRICFDSTPIVYYTRPTPCARAPLSCIDHQPQAGVRVPSTMSGPPSQGLAPLRGDKAVAYKTSAADSILDAEKYIYCASHASGIQDDDRA